MHSLCNSLQKNHEIQFAGVISSLQRFKSVLANGQDRPDLHLDDDDVNFVLHASIPSSRHHARLMKIRLQPYLPPGLPLRRCCHINLRFASRFLIPHATTASLILEIHRDAFDRVP
jgi:hypothetical protein